MTLMLKPNQLRNSVRFLLSSLSRFEALMVCEEEILVGGSTPQQTASHTDSDISLASTTHESNHTVQSATSRGVVNAKSLRPEFLPHSCYTVASIYKKWKKRDPREQGPPGRE